MQGKTARMAAVYHFKLCRAILWGFRKQLQKDGNCQDGFVGILEAGLGRGERETELYELRGHDGEIMNVHIENSTIFKDDLTGQLLIQNLFELPVRRSWSTSRSRRSGSCGRPAIAVT